MQWWSRLQLKSPKKKNILGVLHSGRIDGALLQRLGRILVVFKDAEKQYWIFSQDLCLRFSIYITLLEKRIDTPVTTAATIHACSGCAEIFLLSFCNGTVFIFLCVSGRLTAKGEASFHIYKQAMPTVFFFFFLAIDSQIHAFPLCDIPLWGEREREPHHEWTSMLFKQHAWRSHQNLVVPKALSCPHIPHRCLRCRLVNKLICWFRGHKKGGNHAFFVQQ